jgi:hypothetical protein
MACSAGTVRWTDFEGAYSKWRNQRFPLGSSDDALGELHADLALVDTWVAEALIPFVEHGMYRPIQVDPIQKLEEIRDRATELGKSATADEKRLASEYVEYADLLRSVYELLLKKVDDSGRPT